MERIFWVRNGELEEVNRWLQKGGRVKSIHPLCERITSYAHSGSGGYYNEPEHGYYTGNVYAYVIVEFD